MAEARKEGFGRTALDMIPDIVSPQITDEIQQSLARCLVWDAINKVWREAAGDAYGRFLTTPGMVDPSAIAPRNVSVQVAETVLLASNPRRQFFWCANGGPFEMNLGFRAGDIATFILIWANNVSFSMIGYTGPVFAASPTGIQNAFVLEG